MPAGLIDLDDEAVLAQLFAPVSHLPALALAVSGGADSLALLLLAQRWAQPRGVRLMVYSMDHGLRPEAAAEVRAVLDAAERLGIAACGLRWDGPYPQNGVQQAARLARYRLLGAAMAADGIGVVATGHHLHDQAETVLMRLAHGSGLEGLRGMGVFSDVEGVRIFRPLLRVAPQELRRLVKAAGLVPADDPSNGDDRYERVRWREMLAPLTALGLTPERLTTLALRVGAAQNVVGDQAAEADLALVQRLPDEIRLDRQGFTALPEAVAALLLSRLLAEVGGDQKSRALGPVERLRLALGQAEVFTARTLHGCRIGRNETAISIRREPGRTAKPRRAAAMHPIEL